MLSVLHLRTELTIALRQLYDLRLEVHIQDVTEKQQSKLQAMPSVLQAYSDRLEEEITKSKELSKWKMDKLSEENAALKEEIERVRG